MKRQRGICSIKGCNRVVDMRGSVNGKRYYRDLCGPHRRERRELNKIRNLNLCSLCSWVGPCDAHRLKGTGSRYSRKNTIVVCPNCHRLIHRGLLKV